MLYALAAILSKLGNINNIINHKHCDACILISPKKELLLLEEKPTH
jgi:phosphotransferase system IIB component